jgi:hypothetical protein
MMAEICAHIMDIVANSITAEAKKVDIFIAQDKKRALFTIKVVDDGKGMTEEMSKKVQDPFFSTKTGRKVGLGIPLFKGTAEHCGGDFYLKSKIGEGTEIFASFALNNPDLPPLGNLKDTILVMIVSNPEVNFSFSYTINGKEFTLDTKEIKAQLGSVPINHPQVISFLGKYLDENL